MMPKHTIHTYTCICILPKDSVIYFLKVKVVMNLQAKVSTLHSHAHKTYSLILVYTNSPRICAVSFLQSVENTNCLLQKPTRKQQKQTVNSFKCGKCAKSSPLNTAMAKIKYVRKYERTNDFSAAGQQQA